MDIHEYQAKEILAKFGVPIPKGALAYSPEQAAYRAHEIGGKLWVVKAQVHTGGRGKAGGVKLCRNEHEVLDAANDLLGKTLITHQSGPAGKIVYRLYVEGGVAIARELYLGFVLDRKSERVMVVASAAGGMEIEDIAVEKPDSIIRVSVEPAVGMQAFQAREIAFALGLAPAQIQQAVTIILGCYRAFEELDATMVEINPLIVTEDGAMLALDAKMTFDDNATFRHPTIAELRDKSQEDARETRAADRGLSYVGLTGNIGCIVNGAGLAMATMDLVKRYGGDPANFLDIGGSSNPQKVVTAIKIILEDPKIRAILINIFGGITRCDDVAKGIVTAINELKPSVPIVVRLTGTNEEKAHKILRSVNLPFGETLDEVVKKAINLAGIVA
jgi:succinyl-CoA synthetase beta subunit/malate-CoA ligase subunit beta